LVAWPGAAGRHGLDLVLELGETWRPAVFGGMSAMLIALAGLP